MQLFVDGVFLSMVIEDIAECVPSLSFDELRELEAEIMQLA